MGFNGEYDLDLNEGRVLRYKRRSATVAGVVPIVPSWITFDDEQKAWVLASDQDLRLVQVKREGAHPLDAEWERGVHSAVVRESPSLVASLAFPFPRLNLDFYACSGVTRYPLLKHPGLVMLATSRPSERVPAVLIKYTGAGHARFTVLYSHGNGEDLGFLLDMLEGLGRILQADIFVYDYVGYSTSGLEGMAPSEAGCLRAVTAAWEHLTLTLKLHPSSIVLYGRSIGSGPTVDLASRSCCNDAIAGVILSSPIMSGACVLMGGGTGRLARPFDIFCNYAKIPHVQVPVAIMHGTTDEVVPLSNGEALHAACRKPHPPLWVEGAGHNDMPEVRCAEYAAAFLSGLPPPISSLPLPEDGESETSVEGNEVVEKDNCTVS